VTVEDALGSAAGASLVEVGGCLDRAEPRMNERIKRLLDYVRYAEAFGATGLMINKPDEIGPVLKRAFDLDGPVVVGVHVDYSDNHKLFELDGKTTSTDPRKAL
jgi:thiamine pyrophosphate-dependent acetolactate synthase large subunit-like protein